MLLRKENNKRGRAKVGIRKMSGTPRPLQVPKSDTHQRCSSATLPLECSTIVESEPLMTKANTEELVHSKWPQDRLRARLRLVILAPARVFVLPCPVTGKATFEHNKATGGNLFVLADSSNHGGSHELTSTRHFQCYPMTSALSALYH